MEQIRVINTCEGKWYKKGQVFDVKDKNRYAGIGVQVFMEGNGHTPDVVMDGDYEFI